MFYVGDVLETLKKLPSESVHCCVTSPPYFRLRDYGIEGQLGLERTPEEYVEKLVKVFREVRRVLRKDGILWVNLGDCFAGAGDRRGGKGDEHGQMKKWATPDLAIGLKPKDLIGIPWMVAFALRVDGWYLRSDIVWAKPNVLPESVTDRPTKAHEYVFLLAKSERYFYDADAIKEPLLHPNATGTYGTKHVHVQNPQYSHSGRSYVHPTGGRNKRSVWWIATEPFPEAHFATFPTALVEPCIKAGTSEYGCCPKCGAPWERVAEKVGTYREQPGRRYRPSGVTMRNDVEVHGGRIGDGIPKIITGWRPTCPCGIEETVPCVVLDPFGGAGTVSLVAKQLGRASIYIDLNPAYADMAIRRCGFGQQGLFEQHVYELVKGGVA